MYQHVGSRFTQIGDQADGFGSVDLTALTPALRPDTFIGGPLTQSTFTFNPELPAYNILNTRIGVLSGVWDIAFFINNVTDAPTLRLHIGRRLSVEVKGVEPFLLVDDVVAVEDGAALVPGEAHGDPLGHAGAGRPGSGAQRLASYGPVTIRATTPHHAAIGPWRLALLCLLAPGPVFLHPEADCLLGGVRHLPPLPNWRRRSGCRWVRIQLRKGLEDVDPLSIEFS